MDSGYLWNPSKWRAALWPLRLTRTQQSIFRDLWDTCWIEGGIPGDLEQVAAKVVADLAELQAIWPLIRSEFIPLDDGRLSVPDLEADRARLKAFRNERSEAGRKGGLARAQAQLKLSKGKAKADSGKLKPVPVSVPEGNKGDGEAASPPPPETRPFGEFGWAVFTKDQVDKLLSKLGKPQLEAYIARFDRWVQEAPEAKASGTKRKNRSAYLSILNWYDRDMKEGKIPDPQKSFPMTAANLTPRDYL